MIWNQNRRLEHIMREFLIRCAMLFLSQSIACNPKVFKIYWRQHLELRMALLERFGPLSAPGVFLLHHCLSFEGVLLIFWVFTWVLNYFLQIKKKWGVLCPFWSLGHQNLPKPRVFSLSYWVFSLSFAFLSPWVFFKMSKLEAWFNMNIRQY